MVEIDERALSDSDKSDLISELKGLNMTDLVATHRRLHQMAAQGNLLTGFSQADMEWFHARTEDELVRRAKNDNRTPPEGSPLQWGRSEAELQEADGEPEGADRHFPSAIGRIKQKAMAKQKKGRSLTDAFCVRSFDFEIRAVGGDGRTLEGYAAVYNQPTRIAALGGDFDEQIMQGAFSRSLAQRQPVVQWEHGKDPRVGAVPIAEPPDISEDTRGLHVRTRLFANPVIEPVRQAIEAQAVKGMSFRFSVPPGGDDWQRRRDDVDLRSVRDADLYELGPVVFPAYDSTSVTVRSLLAQLDVDERRTLLRELAEELRYLNLDFTGRPSAWSAGGGDSSGTAQERDVRASSQSAERARAHRDLLFRGIIRV